MSEIDTSPLLTPEQAPVNKSFVFLGVIFGLLIFTGPLIVFVFLGRPLTWINLVFAGIILFSVVAFIVTSNRSRRAIKAFIAKNNLSPVSTNDLREYLPKTLDVGRERKFANGLLLPIAGRDAYVFDFANKHIPVTSYHYAEYGIAVFKTNLDAPHVYLESKKSLHKAGAWKNWHKLSLEGDFDSHFNTYAEDNDVRARTIALEVLTPDVMLTLRETAQYYDIEINGPYVAIISSEFNFYTVNNMNQLITCLERLMKEFPPS